MDVPNQGKRVRQYRECERARGTNGWAPVVDNGISSPSGDNAFSIRKQNKNGTQVILWNLSSHVWPGDATLLVTVAGKVSSVCDAINYLSGQWSATYTDLNDGQVKKTSYSQRVSTTSLCQ